MIFACRLIVPLIAVVLAWSAAGAVTHTIDGTLPDGGDCPLFGDWDAAEHACRIENDVYPPALRRFFHHINHRMVLYVYRRYIA